MSKITLVGKLKKNIRQIMSSYCPLFLRQKTKQVDKDTTAETVKEKYQRNFTLLKLLKIILCPKIPNSAEVT